MTRSISLKLIEMLVNNTSCNDVSDVLFCVVNVFEGVLIFCLSCYYCGYNAYFMFVLLLPRL